MKLVGKKSKARRKKKNKQEVLALNPVGGHCGPETLRLIISEFETFPR